MLLKNKIQWNKFKDQIGLIQWLMNQVADPLTNRREF